MDPSEEQIELPAETESVCKEFIEADREFGKALDLLDDEIKWQMCAHLAPRIEALLSRHHGAELMSRTTNDWGRVRGYIFHEIREMAAEKRALTKEIRNKMSGLLGN